MKNLTLSLLSIVFSFYTGWFLIGFLTAHPLKMSLFLLVCLILLAFLVMAIWGIKATRQRRLVILVAVAMFFIGYSVNARHFLNQEDYRFVPEISREAGTPGEGHNAIVYFTHGEPETYNPIGWINQFREMDEQQIKFVPFMARPVFIYVLRNKYLEVGTSNHRKTHMEMLHSLEKLYREEGDSTTRFYLCFLDDEPRPDAAVIRALNEGADTITVATVFLTVSNHTAEGQEMIHKLDVKNKFGVELAFTEPMWNSELLMESFLEKVEAQIGDTQREEVAIALIGHGQPDEWDQEWPTETNQEIKFREDIMALFEGEGFKRENMGLAWMDFKNPKPVELMESFVNNGVKKVFYFAAAISADAIHSQVDIPRLVMEYPFPEGVEVINMGAWNNHPTVIRAIKEKIDHKQFQ
ncbi:MAG: ferrochelatase [Bacteroides sp.]|jgi:sirohydrochlorin ferrochelatase|nr:ferrochelatase [Bacteroides sp.]